MAELHVHGGRAVVRSVLDFLSVFDGMRLAEGGEFTRRAFENGKIDLTQVEGLADLVDAETEAQRRQAVQQAGGRLKHLYDGWREKILRASALVEAGIDFADEGDVARDALDQAVEVISELESLIGRHLADNRRGEIIRGGFQVVLAGPPNSGKSSLLNALARRDVAIVADEPGTTRDVLDVHLDLDGLAVTISDTAGFRDDGGGIEKEGMRRALARARSCDLVVWLKNATDPTAPEPTEDILLGDAPVIIVSSKMDLASGCIEDSCDRARICLSAVTGEGISAFSDRIVGLARERIGGDEAPALTQLRHRRALEDCRSALAAFLDGADEADEIRVELLRRAGIAVGRLTGRIDVEDVLGEIFGRFCIGK